MGIMDLRKGSHVEFGQSIYEPFGIAQVEPLSFGALCVVSNVCGCCGYVKRAAKGSDSPNLIVADYTTLPKKRELDELKKIDIFERESIEALTTKSVANEILERLPRTREDMEESIHRGYELARNMSWDRVCQDLFLPGLERAAKRNSTN
jgi:glycogen synthase